MDMADFSTLYRQMYADLGVPLGLLDGIGDAALDSAERRLGVITPDALRTSFSIAGSERKLNQAHNTLLSTLAGGASALSTGSRRFSAPALPFAGFRATTVGESLSRAALRTP
jgi:hypothetical protein